MNTRKIGERKIGDEHRPYIIAELCNNFNNDVSIATSLIRECAYAGVDAVKFQMRLQDDRLNPEQHRGMRDVCREYDVEYLCTVFDLKGLKILREMDVPAIKIGSKECINERFRYAAKGFNEPLIVSTGGCTNEQVDQIAEDADILMHTTSIYPTPYDKVNLDLITAYRVHYPKCIIGFSDHTPTIYTAIGAMAMGACVIEKHVTFDRTQEGPDHASSITPEEMNEIVLASYAFHQKERLIYRKQYPEEALKLGRKA